jgi:hypothetical protein
MKSLKRLGLFAVSLMVVAALTEVVGKAAITVTTPNSAVVNYSLAPGATSSGITPVTNQPVIVIGADTTNTDFGVSTVTLIHVPSLGMRWVGIEPTSGTIVHTGSTAVGAHIIWIDFANKIGIQVLSADEFVIHNGGTTIHTGSVKLIW